MGAVRAAGGRGTARDHQHGQRGRAPRSGDRRRSLQLRRRGHPPPAGLGGARVGLRSRRAASPPSPSSRCTAWPSFSGRPSWPAAVVGRSRRRSSPPRCGRALAGSPGSSLRSPATPPPRRPSSPPIGSCAISPTGRSTPWPRASDRAADVVRLHRAARASLEAEFYDEEDLLDSAAEALQQNDDGRRRGSGPVIVYLPERLSRHGGALLSAVGRRQATSWSWRGPPATPGPTPRSSGRSAAST